MNKLHLIGNLGADPELRYTPAGSAVATLRLATNEAWTDKAGAKHTSTEWHRVVVWGKQAESVAKYTKKGRQLYIEGPVRTRSYEKDGMKKFITEVIAKKVTFLGGGREAEVSTPSDDAPENNREQAPI